VPAYAFISGYLSFHFGLSNLFFFSFSFFLSFLFIEFLFYILKTSRSHKDIKNLLIFSLPAFTLGCILNYARYEPVSETIQDLRKITVVLDIPKQALADRPFVIEHLEMKVRLTGLSKYPEVYGNYIRAFQCQLLKNKAIDIIHNGHRKCFLNDIVITKSNISNNWLLRRFKGNNMATAIFLSKPSELNSQILYAARNLGIAHLFAASGLHLGILFFMITWLSKIFKVSRPELIALLFCLVYTLLLDFPISLNRALIFASVYTFGKILAFKVYFPSLLFFSASVVEVLFPGSIFSYGFIFSFSVTASIVAFHQPLFDLLKWKPLYLSKSLALQLSASIVAAPLSYLLFSQYSIFSLLLNLILIPLMPLILLACWFHCIIPVDAVLNFVEISITGILKYFFHIDNQFKVSNQILHFPLILIASIIPTLPTLLPDYLKSFLAGRLKVMLIFILLPLYNLEYSSKVREVITMPGRILSITGNHGDLHQIDDSFIKEIKFLHKIPKDLKSLSVQSEYAEPFSTTLPLTQIIKDQKLLKPWLTLPGMNCILFYSFLGPEFFKAEVISSCKNIIVVYSKNIIPLSDEWVETLSNLGYSGSINFVSYYQRVRLPID
jgi:ComEC/Rec2-related protein